MNALKTYLGRQGHERGFSPRILHALSMSHHDASHKEGKLSQVAFVTALYQRGFASPPSPSPDLFACHLPDLLADGILEGCDNGSRVINAKKGELIREIVERGVDRRARNDPFVVCDNPRDSIGLGSLYGI